MHATECFHLWQTHMWGEGDENFDLSTLPGSMPCEKYFVCNQIIFWPCHSFYCYTTSIFRVLIQLNVFKPVSCIALWTTNVGLFKNKLYHYRIKVVSHIRIMSSCYIQYVISLSQCRTSKRFCKREISDRVLIII